MSISEIPRGQFAKAPAGASRSPCPVVNALANHGYIERSGRKIYKEDLHACLSNVGMSYLLGSVFALPTYFEYHDPAKAYLRRPVSTFHRIWTLITNPYAFFDYFGCWNSDQKIEGKKYLDLVNLAAHGAIEHDISLTRKDFDEPEGNNDPQPKLITQMLDSSSDKEYLTTEDLAAFIRARIQQQLHDNPGLVYGQPENQVNCGQVALMMGCFGDGQKVHVKYVKAIFEEERLPIEEGWTKRKWWSMGLVEFFTAVKSLEKLVGVTF